LSKERVLRITCKSIADIGLIGGAKPVLCVSEDFTTNLDHLDLVVTKDYYASFGASNSPSYKVTAEQYLFGNNRRWSNGSLLCPEMPLSRHLKPLIQLIVPGTASWTSQAVAFVHAGRIGSIAPIHFDWDHKWVAHACLIGQKRFFLFPPEAGWLLVPVINTSALRIPQFSGSALP